MDKKSIKYLISTIAAFSIFLAFTLIVAFADVSEINGVKVGLSTMNAAYYKAVPFNSVLYKITSIAQVICVLGAFFFFMLGIVQWSKRRSLLKVDRNIAALGITYAVTIVFYVLFEIVAVNFRPVNLYNKAEASYPSSTTLLSIVFFSTAFFQILRYRKTLAQNHAYFCKLRSYAVSRNRQDALRRTLAQRYFRGDTARRGDSFDLSFKLFAFNRKGKSYRKNVTDITANVL